MRQSQLIEKFIAQIDAENRGEKLPKDQRVQLSEALTSPDLSVILRKVVVDVMKDTAEPMYIAAKMFRPVRLTEGRSIVFPALSDIVVAEVPEGMAYKQVEVAPELFEGETEVSVKKVGVIVRLTDEMISDSQWDIVGIMLDKAARGMARWKEEWCFREFSTHGKVIFDPVKAASNPSLYGTLDTHGLGPDRKTKNGTLSVEDFIDLAIGCLAHGFTPTDIMMHPLVWPIFAKNPLLDKLSLAAFAGNNNKISITPDAVDGRLPFAIQITLSPFIPFDYVEKRFTMYIVDRNEVGIMVIKDEISTEEWDTPERDIRQFKFKERYAPGILNNGRAICVAQNITYALTYPEPDVVKMIE